MYLSANSNLLRFRRYLQAYGTESFTAPLKLCWLFKGNDNIETQYGLLIQTLITKSFDIGLIQIYKFFFFFEFEYVQVYNGSSNVEYFVTRKPT